ncbi:MAG: hypothetical protein GF332_01010 [Candidatus Moranbacteria bacterium]|nr:hypothetical protein [Candidatus Moranbacteria bacterium]
MNPNESPPPPPELERETLRETLKGWAKHKIRETISVIKLTLNNKLQKHLQEESGIKTKKGEILIKERTMAGEPQANEYQFWNAEKWLRMLKKDLLEILEGPLTKHHKPTEDFDRTQYEALVEKIRKQNWTKDTVLTELNKLLNEIPG